MMHSHGSTQAAVQLVQNDGLRRAPPADWLQMCTALGFCYASVVLLLCFGCASAVLLLCLACFWMHMLVARLHHVLGMI